MEIFRDNCSRYGHAVRDVVPGLEVPGHVMCRPAAGEGARLGEHFENLAGLPSGEYLPSQRCLVFVDRN